MGSWVKMVLGFLIRFKVGQAVKSVNYPIQ